MTNTLVFTCALLAVSSACTTTEPDTCVPITCADVGATCGEIDDGCGVAISCGGCAASETCGLVEDNVCGCASEEWIVEEGFDPHPDEPDVGMSPGIAVAPTGEVHLSYHYGRDLRHAVRSVDGAWSTETVDTEIVGQTSVALDQRGELHIVYFRHEGDALSDLLHAHQAPGGDWVLEVIDSGGIGWNASLRIDPSDQLHVVYDFEGEEVRYASVTRGGAWSTTTIGASGGNNPGTSLAVDADGNPHVCFQGADRAIEYATRSAGAWVLLPVDEESGSETSIAVDSSGTPHIAFDAYVGSGLDYAAVSAGTWSAATVPGTTASIAQPSIVVGDDGTIHILYAETGNGWYREARRAPDGSWQRLDVAPPGLGLGYNPQLVQDGRGNLHAVLGKTEDNRTSIRYASACLR